MLTIKLDSIYSILLTETFFERLSNVSRELGRYEIYLVWFSWPVLLLSFSNIKYIELLSAKNYISFAMR